MLMQYVPTPIFVAGVVLLTGKPMLVTVSRVVITNGTVSLEFTFIIEPLPKACPPTKLGRIAEGTVNKSAVVIESVTVNLIFMRINFPIFTYPPMMLLILDATALVVAVIGVYDVGNRLSHTKS